MTNSSLSDMSPVCRRARPEILALPGYSSARSLQKPGSQTVFLDANECSYDPFIGGTGLSRYPAQQPASLVDAMCRWLDISSRHLTITRGADEAIDCLMRTFCVPGVDNVVICPPTFAMYAQSAMLQGVETRSAPLDQNFDIDLKVIDQESDKNTKIIFVCSPNNPTANLMSRDKIIALCKAYAEQAVIVVDETYVEFSAAHSFVGALDQFANLVVLRTLSKSHAAAGLRCGAAIARADITALLQKVLAPYPIPQPVAALATQILQPGNLAKLAENRADIRARRTAYAERFTKLSSVRAVLPSDTNYFLLLTHDASAFCQCAAAANIILRNQSHQSGLANSVRVTIGSPDQMEQLFAALDGRQIAPDKPQRVAQVTRKTNETSISVTVNLDRVAPVRINTGIGFYDHMLDQIAKHGGFSLELDCAGDLKIDPHHSVEDCAIALGQAIRIALGDKLGIGRYGFCLPMDESLVQVALDFGGRFYLDFKADFSESHVGDLPTDMVPHVFYSLAENLQANLHIAVTGDNTHHMVEACFKGFGRALRQAVKIDGTEMPSTKGTL